MYAYNVPGVYLPGRLVRRARGRRKCRTVAVYVPDVAYLRNLLFSLIAVIIFVIFQKQRV